MGIEQLQSRQARPLICPILSGQGLIWYTTPKRKEKKHINLKKQPQKKGDQEESYLNKKTTYKQYVICISIVCESLPWTTWPSKFRYENDTVNGPTLIKPRSGRFAVS